MRIAIARASRLLVFAAAFPTSFVSAGPHASVTFCYRILTSSMIATPEATEAAYQDFFAAHH
jgi:hypothetical protein